MSLISFLHWSFHRLNFLSLFFSCYTTSWRNIKLNLVIIRSVPAPQNPDVEFQLWLLYKDFLCAGFTFPSSWMLPTSCLPVHRAMCSHGPRMDHLHFYSVFLCLLPYIQASFFTESDCPKILSHCLKSSPYSMFFSCLFASSKIYFWNTVVNKLK